MLDKLKDQVSETANKIYRAGLTWGPGGNVSAFDPNSGYVVITPSGIALEAVTPKNLSVIDLDGNPVEPGLKPSSETPMHTRVYRDLGERFKGLVHTHSTAATTLSCLHMNLPPIHYLMGGVGEEVPLALYATYGTAEMGDRVIEVIGQNKAVLLANHGVLAGGADVLDAAWVAQAVEYVAQLYLKATSIGRPRTLAHDEIQRLQKRFETYGQ